MLKPVSILIFIITCQVELLAQELPLIPDKPGTFEILGRTNYSPSDCGFTKAEMASNLQKITDVVNSVRKNPVLSDIKRFDGRARIYNVPCTDEGNYGIPSRISFEFASWYRKKDGTESRGFIEPPEWSMVVNKLNPNINRWHFSATSITGDPRFFIPPLKKKNIEKGIDEYDGECYIIYNPEYWDRSLPRSAIQFIYFRSITK